MPVVHSHFNASDNDDAESSAEHNSGAANRHDGTFDSSAVAFTDRSAHHHSHHCGHAGS